MKAVDTNVLARLVLQDDAEQTRRAADVVSGPVWIAHTVWVELGWVLGRSLRLDRAVVADALDAILAMSTVHVADRDGIAWAIKRFREGADWADAMHLIAIKGVADRFATFDRGVGRIAGTPIPIEILA